ncbi:uncharacterized protein LOC123394923 [Hordeum vulgare subsp. vulgare]|nr:uncharacterized protein LOC123394923 [Hordeum vulgare subsp. vulgare]
MVITTTPQEQEAVGVKDPEGVAMRKMWRPRQPVKAPLKAVRVKDAQGVSVIVVDRKVEESILGAPVVMAAMDREKGPMEDGVAVCRMDALDGSPVKTRLEPVGVKDAEGVAAGKVRRPRQTVKAPLEAMRVKDTVGVAAGKMWRPRQPTKAPLEAMGVKDAIGVAVISVDRKVEESILGAPVVVAAGGGEKGPLEDGIMVCQVDALDGAPVMTRQEAVGVKDAEGVAVGKMWWTRKPAKASLEALGVKDDKGIAMITVDQKVKASVLGAPMVVAAGRGDKGPLEEGIIVCQVDAVDGASVIAMTQQEALGVNDTEEVPVGKMWWPRRLAKATPEAAGVKDVEGVAVIAVDGVVKPLVLQVPVVAAAEGGEKGSLEDGTVVCQVDTLDGAPVIATDEKEEISVQGNPVFSAVDQKVDTPGVEGVQAITMKGNGKEDKEGIKWLKHYSTAQSILMVGDGDFSFSLALATTFGSGWNLVATSLDSYEALTSKYGKAESNVRELKRLGATVLHGVDAKKMMLHSYLETRRFDRIVFNFPHAGFNGRENWLRVIKAHKQLVHGFLANARQLLRPYGEIHLSHKTGLPYDAWDIEQLAYKSCLIMVRKVDFSKEDYPGYNQKKGDGVTCDESFPLGPCCTFMFCVEDVEKLKQAHGNRVGLISSCLGGSKFYPGISATDMAWPFDLHPAWPQPHFPPLHLPIAFDPCPFGAAGMEYPFDCYGTSFHHQDMVQPTHQQQQPWYQVGPPPIEQPWTPQEQQSLQRGYEIHRQLTPSLEDRYMESVEKQAMFEMLIQVYGRQ